MPDPLPCPFCGSKRVYPATSSGCYVARCSECETEGPAVDESDLPEAAIEAWNRRALIVATPPAQGCELRIRFICAALAGCARLEGHVAARARVAVTMADAAISEAGLDG